MKAAWDGHRGEEMVEHSELFRKVSEGLMGIFEWPVEPLAMGRVIRPLKTVGEECGIPGQFEVPDGGLEAIAQSRRGLPGQLRTVNIHSEPVIVNRLIRLLEELLERDEVDADMGWYRNRLREIKKEIADAQAT